MRRGAFGATGLQVTPVGLGLAALGRPAYINLDHGEDLPADRSVEGLRAHAVSVLDHAWDLGIRYVDAARSYGRAERFLGEWLDEAPARAAETTVGSKWGYIYTADWQVDAGNHEVKDHSVATLRRQLPETRARLGGHLDLYQIHSATLATGVLEDVHVLEALQDLAARGIVIGLTLSGPDQARTLERALELADEGDAPFRSVQATWNLLEPSVGPALEAAADAGWGVIVKEAVANGRLTPKRRVDPCLEAAAREHGTTVDAMAIAAVLAQPFTSVVLSGATTAAQLTSNVAAVDLDLAPGVVSELTALAEPPERYWAARDELAWT